MAHPRRQKLKPVHHASISSVVLCVFSVALALTALSPIRQAPRSQTPLPASPPAASAPGKAHAPPAKVVAAPPAVQPAETAAESEPAMPPRTEPQISSIPLPAPKPGDGHVNYPYVALMSPNDTLYASQWNLSKMAAPLAWDSATGANTTIAIIDTGFGLSHQDLAGRWWTNPGEIGPTAAQGPVPNCTSRGLPLDKSCNNLDNDGDGYPSDWRGWDFSNDDNNPVAGSTSPSSSAAFHGTYVAALAAASGNNGTGIAGVSWGSKIMPLQVLGDDGTGYTDEIASAVRYAADHGANVINMSLGSTYDDPYLHQQIDYAIARGVTVVAAAGNAGCDCLAYPANYPEVTAVGASDQNDNLASFSSYGINLDLVAPGTGGICSAYWTAANPTTGYSCGGQGTSFSAPQVSGALALVAGEYPAATPAQLASYLTAAAFKLPGMGGAKFTTRFGYGRMDIYNTLLQAGVPPPVPSGKQYIQSVDLSYGPDLLAPCRAQNLSCGLRLTSSTGSVVAISAQTVSSWGGTPLYWTAATGIAPGQWLVEATNGTATVTQSPALITISP